MESEDSHHSPLGDSLFASRVAEIQKTNEMLNNLENKLNGFFRERRQSEPKKESPRTRRHDFKIFGKSAPKDQRPLEELMNRKTELSNQRLTDRECRSERVHQLDRMEQYYKRKNAMIENKILQLQQDLDLDEQQRLAMYQQNQRLQRQLRELKTAVYVEPIAEGDQGFSLQILQLERELNDKREKNGKLKKELDVLKQNYSTIKRTKTQYLQNDIRHANTESEVKKEVELLKEELEREKAKHKHLKQKFAKNEEVQKLTKELQRLKNIVAQRRSR